MAEEFQFLNEMSEQEFVERINGAFLVVFVIGITKSCLLLDLLVICFNPFSDEDEVCQV